jgi:hypothetical protein
MNIEDFKKQVNNHFDLGLEPYKKYVDEVSKKAEQVKESMKEPKNKNVDDKGKDEEDMVL